MKREKTEFKLLTFQNTRQNSVCLSVFKLSDYFNLLMYKMYHVSLSKQKIDSEKGYITGATRYISPSNYILINKEDINQKCCQDKEKKSLLLHRFLLMKMCLSFVQTIFLFLFSSLPLFKVQ